MSVDLQRTGLNRWHRDHGAQMVEFAGWEMPLSYPTGIVEEHLATRRYGGLFDISHMGRFLVRGEDAVAFLQRVTSNHVLALDPGLAQYTTIPMKAAGPSTTPISTGGTRGERPRRDPPFFWWSTPPIGRRTGSGSARRRGPSLASSWRIERRRSP